MADKRITIKHGTPGVPVDPQLTLIGIDDTVTFEVKDDCCINFTPNRCFGRRLRVKADIHGPYSPSIHPSVSLPLQVDLDILDINSTGELPPIRIKSYSIKVG
jgi:hypothetical protein